MTTLSYERLKELLHYDPKSGVFTRKVSLSNRVKIGDVAGSPERGGYIRITVDGRRFKAHRLAWFYMTGEWPKEHIDHINGVTDDNSFSNLREATRFENMRNIKKPSTNTSGLKGAFFNKMSGRWEARIKAMGKSIYLGLFDTHEEAHAAYVAAAKIHHGEFARVE